jgi:hypothetical protein
VGDIVVKKGAEFGLCLGGPFVIAVVKGGVNLEEACGIGEGVGTKVGNPGGGDLLVEATGDEYLGEVGGPQLGEIPSQS